ncbi:MAG: hypothetical protein ACWGPS_03205 [Candidatus Promineifilaceae bacterium]
MESTDLIIEALAVQPTPNIPASYAEDDIDKAQDELVELLRLHMGDQPDAAAMIKRFLESPDIWTEHLAEALRRSEADSDPAIVEAAREVLRLARPVEPDEEGAEELPSSLPGVIESGE